MQLEEMREFWQRHHQSVDPMPLIPKKILTGTINRVRGKSFKTTIRKSGYLLVSVILFLGLLMPPIHWDNYIVASFCFFSTWLLGNTLFPLYKIKLTQKIGSGILSLADTMHKAGILELRTLKVKFLNIVLMPVIVLTVYSLVMFIAFNINVFLQFGKYGWEVILYMMMSSIISFVMYKKIYLPRYRQAKANLKTIKAPDNV